MKEQLGRDTTLMSRLTVRAFLSGPDSVRNAGHWHPLAALTAAVLVIAAGQSVPIMAIALLGSRAPRGNTGAGPTAENSVLSDAEVGWLLIASQATLALLTIAVAAMHRAQPRDVLHLDWPQGGWRAFLYAFLLMLPLLLLFNGLAYAISPEGYAADFRQFKALAQSSTPWASFAAIGVGAPLWEELLFRGFLLGPFSVAIGFWPAALLVSGAWTLLHWGYSLAGLTEVFLIGLYFAWLLRRTGSLWVPIACHAAYNATLFMAMRHLVA